MKDVYFHLYGLMTMVWTQCLHVLFVQELKNKNKKTLVMDIIQINNSVLGD